VSAEHYDLLREVRAAALDFDILDGLAACEVGLPPDGVAGRRERADDVFARVDEGASTLCITQIALADRIGERDHVTFEARFPLHR
jgi:hypothetical protein